MTSHTSFASQPHAAGDAARIRAAVAPMMSQPRISSALTSQLTAGHAVALLEQDGEWWKVRGEDGYEGFVHAGYLESSHGRESDWPVITGGVVREADGRVRALPFGARVAPDAMVLSGEVFDDDERALRFPAEPLAVAASAETMFVGASYLWGGVTPWGCDCSGFVQAVCALHDIPLPRDAWQQAQEGTPIQVATLNVTVLQAGDLLFFSDAADRRITHVAMMLEHQRMVHSALSRGGVQVEALHGDDPYVRRLREQFVTARRLPARRALS